MWADADFVTGPDPAGADDLGVDAGAGLQAEAFDADPVVLGVATQAGGGQYQVGAEHPRGWCRAGRAGDGGQGRGW